MGLWTTLILTEATCKCGKPLVVKRKFFPGDWVYLPYPKGYEKKNSGVVMDSCDRSDFEYQIKRFDEWQDMYLYFYANGSDLEPLIQ